MTTITDYATLQSAVADTLNREDLTTQIPRFIQLFEAEVDRRLRVRAMMVRADARSDEGYVPVPSDFLEAYTLTIESDTPQPPLTYVPLAERARVKALYPASADTRHYTIIGDTFELIADPPDDLDLELIYYARVPALSGSNTTNWLLTRAPDFYLYGSLLHSATFLKDDERVPLWLGAVDRVFDQLHMESERDMRPRGSLNAPVRSFG